MTQYQARTALNELPVDYPILRNGIYRSHVEGVLTDVSKLIGMSDALLRTVLTMIRYTRPSDWNDPTAEPICSKMQSDLAITLGKTDRAVRNDERALELTFGMIRKNVSANGSRRSDGDGYHQGMSFSPLIEMMDDLEALRDRRREDEQTRKTLRLKCSAMRRLVKSALMELHPEFPENEVLCGVRDMFLSWAPRYSDYKSLEALEEHYFEALEASKAVDEVRQLCKNTSARAEANFRLYIQDTNHEIPVTCNDTVDKRPEGKPSEIYVKGSLPNGSNRCLENKCEDESEARNLLFMENMTLERLFELASHELKSHVTFCKGDRYDLREIDFIHGAHGILHPLGISDASYHDAVSSMGQHLTTLSLLIIDANRNHPVTPVRNPGGLLRAMTRKHASGQLNIAGSLIGLSARMAAE